MKLEDRARRAAGAILRGAELMPARAAAAAPGTYEGFLRFVDRRRRNQRIGTILTALLLAALAIGGAVRLLRSANVQRPAQQVITPERVSDLEATWSVSSHEPADAYSPTVGDHSLYVTTNRGELLAYPGDCAKRCPTEWQASTSGRALSKPAVSGGMVYAAEASGDPGARVYAFDSACGTDGATCEPVWTAEVGNGVRWDQPPMTAAGQVIVPSSDGLYAFREGCGASGAACGPSWVAHPSGAILASTTDGITVYVATQTEVAAYPASCATKCDASWRRTIPENPNSLAIWGNTLLMGTALQPPDTNHVYALRADCPKADGCPLEWSIPTLGVTYITVSGGTAYVQDQAGEIAAYPLPCEPTPRGSCRPRWRGPNPAGWQLAGYPVVADGVVYVGSQDGYVFAYRAACEGTCAPIWETSQAGYGWVRLAVGGGRVYAGSDGIYAFGAGSQQGRDPGDGASPGSSPLVFPIALAIVVLAVLTNRFFRTRPREGHRLS